MLLFFIISCLDYNIKERQEPLPEEDPLAEPSEEEALIPDCSVAAATIEEIEIDEECLTPEYNIQNPWNVEIEWQWNGLGTEPYVDQIMVAPIVGNLTDDDGDGQVTETDTPDIVVVIFDSRYGADGDMGAWVDGR